MPQHRHAPVVDTSASPHARLRPVSVGDVTVADDFWRPRLDRNRAVTIPAQHALCESTGALRNFERAAGADDGPFNGRYYSDSDVYKWIEAASWSLSSVSDAEIAGLLDSVIGLAAGAQDADGYLNTHFSVDLVAKRWSDLIVKHEMYCVGHLVQAAVAHHRATGGRDLLDVALRACGHIMERFAPGEVPGTCGHPCLEMALVELYRTTGERRWLELASWQLESRGKGVLDGSEYLLDHRPLREQTYVTGHAVRALYLYAAAVDVVLETGDEKLLAVVERLWADLAGHKTSVTGGVGARWDGEAFGDAYELPDRAYNETCAAIAHIMLAWRLLLLTGDATYRDTIETALYNGVLPGLSLSGTEFFYQNPLADAGRHRREEWFSCACCPPNIARLLASLPGYLYTTSTEGTTEGVWVQLYVSNRARLRLADGTPVDLELATGLPWHGDVRLTVGTDAEFTLRLPVPAWAGDEVSLTVAGAPVAAERAGGYLVIHRAWRAGDTALLRLGDAPRPLAGHPRVAATHHRVALARGPIVYCLEQADHDGVAVEDIRLRGDEEWTAAYRPDLLGGVVTLTASGHAVTGDDGPLHRPYRPGPAATEPVTVTAVPYFAWANRAPGAMRVFVPLT